MKRVKSRAAAALLLALALLFGMGAYVLRYAEEGENWVMFSANENVYSEGTVILGSITDRHGVLLAHTQDGERCYAADAATRRACLHAVGDFEGNIGTGAVTVFAEEMTAYDPIAGLAAGGGRLALSIDAELNRIAYEALDSRRGAVMLMNYETGEILCMLSTPSYDPVAGFDREDEAFEGAYLNRCLSASYTPGSVFKLVTLAAAIETIPDLYERSFSCAGSKDVNGIAIKCTGWHGEQTIEQALANSCNCAFAQISLELGPEVLADYADRLGFCESHRVSGIETRAGSFEKAATLSADLAWSGIGQYTDLVNPYAMLRYVSAIANGGSVHEGVLLKGESSEQTELLSADTADKIAQMMSYTVIYSYGAENFPDLALCAKSGTAELGDGSSHAWFTGFLTDEAHPYAFCVVIEEGGSGLRNAGALANTLLQAAVGAETE